MDQLNNNLAGTVGGSLAVVYGKIQGIVSIEAPNKFFDWEAFFNNMTETIILAIVGAVIGFLVNKFCKWADKKIKGWIKK